MNDHDMEGLPADSPTQAERILIVDGVSSSPRV
jgi:hypothetical protein